MMNRLRASITISMAWRETRGNWRHFVYFLTCLALGVGAIVGIGLFATHVERAVTREARGLLGGDVEIRVPRRLSASGQMFLQSLAERGIHTSHASELVAMAASARDQVPVTVSLTQLIELKAVESTYPLYGTVTVEPNLPLPELLAPPVSACAGSATSPNDVPSTSHMPRLTVHTPCHGAVVQESLLIRMGLALGDSVKIGQTRFLITGIVRKEPDRMANMFSLGPRVLISQQGLDSTELIKPGSRVRERYLLKVPGATALSPLLHEVRGRLSAESIRASSYRDAQPQLKQFLEQLARYLGLIGLTTLFIGGIGVAMSVQAFLREKLSTIAVLKALGADAPTIISIYLTQALGLGLLGSLAGVAVGVMLQGVLPGVMAGLLGTNLLDQVNFSSEASRDSVLPSLNGLTTGLLTTLLFSLWPLLGIRQVRPVSVFRRDVETNLQRVSRAPLAWTAWLGWRLRIEDRTKIGAGCVVAIGLAGLALWQAGSWRIGLLFLAGLIGAVLLLVATAHLLLRIIPALPRPHALSVRQAIGNLRRPGSQAVGVIIAIGIGIMVMATVAVLERSLIQEMGESRPSDAPTFFFIDLQPDQTQSFTRFIREQTAGVEPAVTPLVRSRLHAIQGQPVTIREDSEEEDDRREEKRKAWYLTREYVLTFGDRLPKDNTVIQGAWWTPGQAFTKPLVSVEEEAAKNLGLTIGSYVSLDIQGTVITAEISSIRKVDWGNFSTNFYMILSPGALDGAPITYVASVRVRPDQEAALQQAVVAAFPNVTAINIGDVLESFTRVLDRLSLAVRAVAVFCIVAGGLVMAAALAATRYRRLYESVILKALGATRGLIARSFAAEYFLMGTVAGAIGMTLASALSWAVLRFVFDLAWTLQPAVLGLGWLSTALLTLIIGFLSTYHILGERPLAILRHE